VKAPAALGDLPRPLYFFDGHCVLRSGFVAFCIARDPDRRMKFASAQSSLGQRVLKAVGLPDDTFERTILLLDGEEVYFRSAAALRSLRHLRGPVRWLRPLLLVPASLRDPLYDIVARKRYRWFGRRVTCFAPTPETRDRFIDL
jgi:predicted DCC family thiol-disulfide oxidoreductase YuxK